MRRDRLGLTLVELVTTLALIALLTAVGYPLLTNTLSVLTSKGASEQVASAIRQARQEAITRGSRHCIEFQGSPSTSYRIRATNAGGTTCSGTILEDWTDVGNKAAVTSPSPAPTIVFDTVGNVASPAAPVTFLIDTQPASCASTVIITIYGGVRVQKC